MKTIYKYKNRKLYDTDDSRYVTLHDLVRYVKENVEFEIVDHRTKEDVTRTILCTMWYSFDLMPQSMEALKKEIRKLDLPEKMTVVKEATAEADGAAS